MNKYWLMKSEPEEYSIDQLRKDGKTLWEGVRNYQARNYMTNDMQVGDMVIFYHSNSKPSGAAGLAQVSALAKPDPSQFAAQNPYFDPKSTPEKPIWFCVEVQFVDRFAHFVSLTEIKEQVTLRQMTLLKKGCRLSIQPLSPLEYKTICKLGGK